MRFTCVMFGGSLALLVVAYLLVGAGLLTSVGLLWFVASFPLVAVYWIVRVIRRAWRDGTHESRAAI